MLDIDCSFAPPNDGWLPVRIRVAARVIEFIASDVPNNPVEALYDAVAAAAYGLGGSVWWHLEPDGYFFELTSTSGDIRLRILFANDSEISEQVEIVSIVGSKTEVLLPLWRALRQFESWQPQELHWPRTRLAGLSDLRAIL